MPDKDPDFEHWKADLAQDSDPLARRDGELLERVLAKMVCLSELMEGVETGAPGLVRAARSTITLEDLDRGLYGIG